MKQSDIGLIESLNEEVDKIQRHGCIVPRVEMGTKDFLDTVAIINRQKAEIEWLEEENRRMKKYYFTHDYHECHNEAIREFSERLKNKLLSKGFYPVIFKNSINEVCEEMTEGNDE